MSLPRLGSPRTPVDDAAIGRRLKELRKRRGWSQAEVAEKLGVHQSLVSAYERGAVRLYGGLVAAFAEMFRTSADQVLGLKIHQDNGVIGDRRFIRRLQRIEKLPKRSKQALLKTIDTYLHGAEKP